MGVDFECTTAIEASPSTVFDLALSVDAHLQSMAGSGERAIGGVTTGLIGLGEQVTWRAVHFGVPFRMTSRVTELERPKRFVDEQVSGPFRRFRHEHLFLATDSGTLMTDRVSFEAPVAGVGRLVERAVLARYMKKLIEERGAYLKAAAERAAADGMQGC
jgi:ligand-binding SRPBCC domain-containing protein